MQKHAGKGFPDYIDRIELAKQDGTVKYPVIRDEMGLAYLANQNTITFHIPGFRASNLEHPDRMVFDLDPSEGDLDGVRYAARATAEFLAALDVPTWLMTSGLSGSPAPSSSRSAPRPSLPPRSAWMSMRQTVGGAQNVVTPCVRSCSSSAAASNRV